MSGGGWLLGAEHAVVRHEAAAALGAVTDPGCVTHKHTRLTITQVLQNPCEHAMVRHEAAEALGAVADPGCVALLQAHAADPEPIVAHSCVVALDVLEHEASGAFEYCAAADAGGGGGGSAVAAH